jgi:hypothetical protein
MFELFDLQKDPLELLNRVADRGYAPVLRDLKARLQDWMLLNQDYLSLPLPYSEMEK